MRSAILSGAMAIPVDRVDLKALKKQLTYSYKPMGAEEAIEVKGYQVSGDFIHVPRYLGLEVCNRLQIPWDDDTSSGQAVKFPKVPTPREYQKPTLEEIDRALDENYDVLFKAHTGWGKTIGSLICAARRGRNIVVIVDQDNLKEQWMKVLLDPKLFGLKPSQVGLVQGSRCDYKGKVVTIVMVQTLMSRRLPEPFYTHFGTLIGDEVHTLGAPTFSRVLLRFSATARLFVSATPRRRDGLQKALDYNCGPISVAAEKEHDESKVYLLRNEKVYSWYANISPKVGRIISEVAEDGYRNLLLCQAVIWLWESGRDVLLLSDRIGHLKNLQSLLVYHGVPADEVGLYTGYDPVYSMAKNPTPKRLPRGLHFTKLRNGKRKYADYTPVSFQVKEKRVPAKKLEEVKTKCSIILATFGKFSKGVDEPRLAGGVDGTPRSTSEQAQGRVQRELEGKLQPIWITVVDENNYRLLNSLVGRLTEYAKNNSRFYEWDGQRETYEWKPKDLLADVRARLKHLKDKMEIRPDNNGGHYLVAKKEEKKKKAQETATAMRQRLKRAVKAR